METVILVISISLLFSAFFSGSEIAFVSTNKLRIQLQNFDQSLIGRILSGFVNNPAKFLTAMLIGNNIAMVVYGAYFSIFITRLWEHWAIWGYDNEPFVFVVQTILASMVVLLFAEFLPKALFSINANKSLRLLALPLIVITTLLTPLVFVILQISNWFLKSVLKIKIADEEDGYNRVDLFHMISEENETTEPGKETDVDTEIFLNAIEFASVKIRDCMIPRTEIVAIEINASIQELTEILQQSGHSKILVYKENIDHIVGYVHSIGLFDNPSSINSIILPIPFAPESMQASNVLRMMIDKRRSIALVVDEFGGTSGIVTVEDIVEEIFGEIEDEHDVEEFLEEEIAPGVYRFSARCEIEYLNDKYHLELPEGDYETLGGCIISVNERIPELGEKVPFGKYTATVEKVEGARVEEILLEIERDETSE